MKLKLLIIMIITKISDGFGNQLFMYACGYAASRRLSTKLALDLTYLSTNNLRNYELDKLNIVYDKIFTVDNIRYPLNIAVRKILHLIIRCQYNLFREKDTYKFDERISNIGENSYLFGYWQTEKYFKDYREDILKIFTPNYELSQTCKLLVEKVKNSNSVAVHVRRGDYVKLGICLNLLYYKNAFAVLNKKFRNLTYFIFSDNVEYAKQMFKDMDGNFEYVENASSNTTLDDFFIMKECKHIIMANSSYSWWAAWLNANPNKIVIYPKDKQSITDFYPKEWIMVE